jgi:hypothetical protein
MVRKSPRELCAYSCPALYFLECSSSQTSITVCLRPAQTTERAFLVSTAFPVIASRDTLEVHVRPLHAMLITLAMTAALVPDAAPRPPVLLLRML